jgi:uncharacterized protein
MVSEETVRASFAHIESDNPDFLKNIADNVSWTAMGTHNPIKGVFTSKSELGKATFGRLVPKLATPIKAKLTNVLVMGDWAAVELKMFSSTKGGNEYNQELCCICRYEGDKIVEVRAYSDTALAKAVLDE